MYCANNFNEPDDLAPKLEESWFSNSSGSAQSTYVHLLGVDQNNNIETYFRNMW